MACSVRRDLQLLAEEKLCEIIAVNQKQLEALHEGDHGKLMTFDKQLERLVGEKERAFGALRQHISEHGC